MFKLDTDIIGIIMGLLLLFGPTLLSLNRKRREDRVRRSREAGDPLPDEGQEPAADRKPDPVPYNVPETEEAGSGEDPWAELLTMFGVEPVKEVRGEEEAGTGMPAEDLQYQSPDEDVPVPDVPAPEQPLEAHPLFHESQPEERPVFAREAEPAPDLFHSGPVQEDSVGMQETGPADILKVEEDKNEKLESLKARIRKNPKDMVLFAELLKPKFE